MELSTVAAPRPWFRLSDAKSDKSPQPSRTRLLLHYSAFILLSVVITYILYHDVCTESWILQVSDDQSHFRCELKDVFRSYGDNLIPVLRASYYCLKSAFGMEWGYYATILLLLHASLAALVAITVHRVGRSLFASWLVFFPFLLSPAFSTGPTIQFVYAFSYVVYIIDLICIILLVERARSPRRWQLPVVTLLGLISMFTWTPNLIVVVLIVIVASALRLATPRDGGRGRLPAMFKLVDWPAVCAVAVMSGAYLGVYFYGISALQNRPIGTHVYGDRPKPAVSESLRSLNFAEYALSASVAPVDASEQKFGQTLTVRGNKVEVPGGVVSGVGVILAAIFLWGFVRGRSKGVEGRLVPLMGIALLIMTMTYCVLTVRARPQQQIHFPYAVYTGFPIMCAAVSVGLGITMGMRGLGGGGRFLLGAVCAAACFVLCESSYRVLQKRIPHLLECREAFVAGCWSRDNPGEPYPGPAEKK